MQNASASEHIRLESSATEPKLHNFCIMPIKECLARLEEMMLLSLNVLIHRKSNRKHLIAIALKIHQL
jgi:hypothetical protein